MYLINRPYHLFVLLLRGSQGEILETLDPLSCWKERVLSINKKFGFEILEIPGAQWNSIFWFHRPKPRYCAFGYCTCFQDTKEQFLGQQFCQMELQTFQFDWMKWPDWSKWTTFKGDPNIIISVEPNQNGPFHLISNQNFQNFGLNKRCPKSAWIDEYAPLSIATCCTLR